jgi:4-hydroxybenzoate polyprenyltransferase
VEDAADDYLVLEKRKRNPISSGELTKKQGHLVGLSLLFIGLSLLLTISYLVFLVGFALISVGILYSWKPIRLKSIPIMDIISHVIGLGALQLSTTYLTFSSFNLQFISLLIIVIPFSVAAEFFQELRDFEIDKKTKINNTIQKLGKINPQKLIIILSIIATLGGVLFFHASSLNMNMVLIIPFMFLSAIIYIECTFKNFNFKK